MSAETSDNSVACLYRLLNRLFYVKMRSSSDGAPFWVYYYGIVSDRSSSC